MIKKKQKSDSQPVSSQARHSNRQLDEPDSRPTLVHFIARTVKWKINARIKTCAYRIFFRGAASLSFDVHYHAQLHRHKQLSYLLKSGHKIENYNMWELSAELFDFVVIFNLDKHSPGFGECMQL